MAKQKIVPCLWFDGNAEEAVQFYMGIFRNSKVVDTAKYLVDTPSNKPKGSVMTIDFELDGQKFLALNGGSFFKFNEAISLMIYCQNQKEIDYFYDKLSADLEAEMCGWIKDKFGVSWQLVTTDMGRVMNGKNAEKAMAALMKMKKINIEELRRVAGK